MKPAAYTDEEWILEQLINESEHACAFCSEDIHSVEELQMLQVVYPNLPNGKVEYYDIESDSGGYQYQPRFFHLQCWEEVEEQLNEILEEYDPFADETGICECCICGAGILAWETTGLLSFGELRRAQRMPNGESTFYFDECNVDPRVICIACLWTINHELVKLWDEVNHNGECEEGTLYRCWRDSNCRNGCCRAEG